MPIGIYMDVHVPRQITTGLRLKKVDVLTSQEDGFEEADDSQILNRSTILGRILFTHDDDFLKEARYRIINKIDFAGIVFAHQLKGQMHRRFRADRQDIG